jgi:hypothetical protein
MSPTVGYSEVYQNQGLCWRISTMITVLKQLETGCRFVLTHKEDGSPRLAIEIVFEYRYYEDAQGYFHYHITHKQRKELIQALQRALSPAYV